MSAGEGSFALDEDGIADFHADDVSAKTVDLAGGHRVGNMGNLAVEIGKTAVGTWD